MTNMIKKIFKINKKYIDAYNIIKEDKIISIDFSNEKYTSDIIEGLFYFNNKKICENLMIKLGKYIREKYINRKKAEQFFDKHINDFGLNLIHICLNTNLSEEFFDTHILNGIKFNWDCLCENTNLSEEFFERHLDKLTLGVFM